MFLNNKYTKWYYNIIKNSNYKEGYGENHHIIPKCIGGCNSPENIVKLTAKEHYIVHKLLIKMTEGETKRKMLFAFIRMSYSSKTHERIKYTSRHFEEAKIANSIANKNKKLSTEHKEKLKKILLENNPMHKEEVKEKIKQTNLEKYGVEHHWANDSIKNKRKENNLSKYGVEYVFQLEEVKEKIKQTNLEKYGYDHNSKVPKIKEKRQATNRKKYGGNSPASSLEVRNKMKNTSIEKYGVSCYSKSVESKKNTIERNENKRNRVIVNEILKNTTRKQRTEYGWGKGWYQKSDEELKKFMDFILQE